MKVLNTLASIRRKKQQLLKKKQMQTAELKIKKICDNVAKTCGIGKHINLTVNDTVDFSFKNIDIESGNSEWAPWSIISKMQKNYHVTNNLDYLNVYYFLLINCLNLIFFC